MYTNGCKAINYLLAETAFILSLILLFIFLFWSVPYWRWE